MKKTIITVSFVLLFVFGCTAVSYKHYVESLNRVTVMDTAPGRLRSVLTANGALSVGEAGGACSFSWEVTPETHLAYDLVTIKLGDRSFPVTLADAEVRYDLNRNVCRMTCPLSEETLSDLRIYDGMYGTVTMESDSSAYGAVLPKRCIYRGSDGFDYAYILGERDTTYGTETYLCRVGVTVEAQDDTNAAVLAPLERVVVGCMRPPTDLEPVLVIE